MNDVSFVNIQSLVAIEVCFLPYSWAVHVLSMLQTIQSTLSFNYQYSFSFSLSLWQVLICVLRVCCFCLMFAFNALMWTTFTKSLQYFTSTVEASATNTACNFTFSVSLIKI